MLEALCDFLSLVAFLREPLLAVVHQPTQLLHLFFAAQQLAAQFLKVFLEHLSPSFRRLGSLELLDLAYQLLLFALELHVLLTQLSDDVLVVSTQKPLALLEL